MGLKGAAVCVAFFLTFTYGAVIPVQEDALFDMVQSFLVQPDEFASAVGMTRVKRSAFDKDFRFDAIGLQVQIKYLDPNNQLKGGKAVITIDNLKKYVKKARSTYVQLTINFDSGASPKDGLFKLSVDYELHHANVEKGTVNLERKKDGALWKTDVAVKSKNSAAVKLIPEFSMSLKSDRKKMLQGTYNCAQGAYSINVDRTPGKKIHAVVEGMGRTYIVDGTLDKAQKNIQIDIDANGLKYKINLDMDDTATDVVLKANVNLGGAGSYNVELNGKKDMTSGGLKILFNGRNFANAKLMGKVDPVAQLFKYEIRYSSVGIGEGKIRLAMKGGDSKELKFQYLPKVGLDLKITLSRNLNADNSRNIQAECTRGGEVYWLYKNDITPIKRASETEVNVVSTFDLSEKSFLYPMFCKYGCFKTRKMKAKAIVITATPYKGSLDVVLSKDGETVLTMDINTKASPYTFKVNAPRILPKILPTGRKSIEFEADHKPGQYLRIKSNTNALQSFKIERISGDMRRVELNGKELVKAGITQGDNSISQTTTLPDGRSLTTTVSWESDNLKKNKVNIKLDGTERNLNADLSWDVTNPANIVMKADAKGENQRWGKYALMRDVKMSSVNGKLNAEWTGVSTFANAPWPSPVNTDVKISVDTTSRDYSFSVKKNVAGRTYGLTLNNGRLSLNL